MCGRLIDVTCRPWPSIAAVETVIGRAGVVSGAPRLEDRVVEVRSVDPTMTRRDRGSQRAWARPAGDLEPPSWPGARPSEPVPRAAASGSSSSERASRPSRFSRSPVRRRDVRLRRGRQAPRPGLPRCSTPSSIVGPAGRLRARLAAGAARPPRGAVRHPDRAPDRPRRDRHRARGADRPRLPARGRRWGGALTPVLADRVVDDAPLLLRPRPAVRVRLGRRSRSPVTAGCSSRRPSRELGDRAADGCDLARRRGPVAAPAARERARAVAGGRCPPGGSCCGGLPRRRLARRPARSPCRCASSAEPAAGHGTDAAVHRKAPAAGRRHADQVPAAATAGPARRRPGRSAPGGPRSARPASRWPRSPPSTARVPPGSGSRSTPRRRSPPATPGSS